MAPQGSQLLIHPCVKCGIRGRTKFLFLSRDGGILPASNVICRFPGTAIPRLGKARENCPTSEQRASHTGNQRENLTFLGASAVSQQPGLPPSAGLRGFLLRNDTKLGISGFYSCVPQEGTEFLWQLHFFYPLQVSAGLQKTNFGLCMWVMAPSWCVLPREGIFTAFFLYL